MSIEQWSDLMFPEREGTVTPIYGSVRAINDDGSYEVQLNASSVTTRCAPCCTAMVGDRVLVLIKPNGKCDAIGRLGGDLGGGGTIVTQYDDVSNYIAGRVFAYAGTDEPIGALLCDGQAVSRTTYWELFDAIGTTYGAGDGSTTFNLPNIESRTIIGESDSYALGSTGGEEAVSLTAEQNGSHTHAQLGVNAHEPNSTTLNLTLQGDGNMVLYQHGGVLWNTGTSSAAEKTNRTVDIGQDGTTGSSGSGAPHNNMQPYIVMRYFITTGKGDPASGINPADYVVEWGNTDGWRWEKWASGKLTLSVFYSVQAETSASGIARTSKSFPFPIDETGSVNVVANARVFGYTNSHATYWGVADNSIVVYANAIAASTSVTVDVTADITCRWKSTSASGGTESIAPTIEERFEGIESDILDMRTNKVLCATAAWMYASETMALSEPISAQDNGVVLVFSFHDGNTTQDSNWVHVPILKEFVARHSGQGTLVNMRGLTNENNGNKYLYITDTTIKGHDSNAAEGMASDGSVYKNQRYLLRYVIGF